MIDQVIIILEGANGVGKSTYANELERRFEMPKCRPFRGGDSGLHWGAEEGAEKKLLAQLKSYGVPVNTHIDDLYVADFLRTFKVGAILDRSLPSAIAYDTVHWLAPGAGVREMLRYWQELLKQAGPRVLYVWMTARHSVAKRRVRERWCPNKDEYRKLNKMFSRIFQDISLPKMRINTTEVEVKDGIRRIWRALKK